MSDIKSTDRGAFNSSSWVEFQKQLYCAEEKIDTKFKKDWKQEVHPYQLSGYKIEHIHEKGDPIPEGATATKKPRHQDVVLGLVSADGSRKPTPFYAEDSDAERWVRSPRANAQVDASVIGQLKEHRWTKKNNRHDKEKFSKSTAVRGCLDFEGGRRNRAASKKSGSTIRSKNNSRANSRASNSRSTNSRATNSRATNSRASSVCSSSSVQLDRKTTRAFDKIIQRMDERRGVSLSQHRLFMRNSLRKYSKEGSRFISLQNFQLFLDNGLGCGAGAVNLMDITASFRDDNQDNEAVDFGRMMEAYMDYARKIKMQLI